MSEEQQRPELSKMHQPVPTSEYNYKELADIYNRAREDYIVPMPMNARRMEEYVTNYDIDLAASFVALDTEDHEPNGICMLGVRGEWTWITRLGVIPVRRRRHAGEFLMQTEIEASRRLGAKYIQLEVIKGNDPAYRLFRKLGFEETRELLVIRRPPAPLDPALIPPMQVEDIPPEQISAVLEGREAGAAWTEDTRSLHNAGSLRGLTVALPSGEIGWIVYHRGAFQLAHFVFAPHISNEMIGALIAAVHQQNPLLDTKIENVPALHPTWTVFQQYGYMDAFWRIEMVLALA